MKRLRIVIPLFLGVFLAAFVLIYGLGRMPSEYVLKNDAAAHQQARRDTYFHFTHEMGKAVSAGADVTELRAKRDTALLQPIETRLGGWQVVYLPPGTKHPSAGTWARAQATDPSGQMDPIPLRGKWLVRLRATSWSARAAAALGLGP